MTTAGLTVDVRICGEHGQRVAVKDVAQARAVCGAKIEEGPYGVSMWRGGWVRRDGKRIAWLSYNGRLWRDSTIDMIELNDDFTTKEGEQT